MSDISKIQLPNGNIYDIKDAVAREMISGGISFIIAWTASDFASTTAPTAAKLATIPAGAEVAYNSGASTATGTLAASLDTKAKFYLIYSKTQAGNLDNYNEYVTVENGSSYIWEKIGDTQIDLSNVVTDVTLNKQTAGVIGSSATLTNTQPTITLSEESGDGGGTRPQYVKTFSSQYLSASTTGTGVDWNSKDQKTVLTGVQVTAQPSVTLTANASTGTGRLKYVEDVTGGSTSPTKVHLSATASGGAVSASGDNVTVVTGVSTSKLATTTVTGVSGSTNITPVESRSSQTTVSGFTASTDDNYDNTSDILKGASVSNETLLIGAYKTNTQTTYSAGAPRASLAVPTAASSATTVATGSVSATGGGATIATGSSGNDTVLGTSSTFSVTNPTITVSTSGSTGPEVVGDVSDITVSPTYKYMSGSASGTAVGANGTADVIGSASTFDVTDPSTSLAGGAQGDISVVINGTVKWLGATATGGGASWNNKDEKTVLDNSTTITVTKGGN